MENQEKAERVIDTFTGKFEKRVLPKMAAALPSWVVPDHLTVLGIFAALVIGGGYVLTYLSLDWIWLVNFGLILHWYADSLDGTLARVREIERERYGYFVDHLCDAITVLFLCLGLGLSPLMHLSVALAISVTYYLLNIYVHIMAYTQHVFRISYYKIGPTEVRILIFLLNIMILVWNPNVVNYRGVSITALDIGGLIITSVFFIVFVVVSIKDAIKLDREDRARWE